MIQQRFFTAVTGLMERLVSEESAAIDRAASVIADAIEADRLLHVFGTGGHSAMGAEEIFFRAGGLVAVNAMLDPGVMLSYGALRSTAVERTPGYARAVLDEYGLTRGDTLIIVNAYGINACTIDAAQLARERGAITIAVTSRELQAALPQGHPSRHPSGANLADLCDHVIDCKVPMGDALIEVSGLPQRVGASSTFLNALALNLLTVAALDELARRGVEPAIWQSANSPGGDEANAQHIERYRMRIKRL
ncbi:MAG TPA: SIS domain-containing protein [Trueperaceae bacterium]|nr:SIS domain-containing protein [Trueperaceae bacterium]